MSRFTRSQGFLWSRVDSERDNFRACGCSIDFQPRHGDRQLEPPRSGAAGIEIHDPALLGDRGHVGMAADDDAKTRDGWIEVQVVNVVNDINLDAVDAHRGSLRNLARPWIAVVVAFDRDYICDRAQPVQDLRRADVAGMEDKIRPLQRLQRLGANKAVRVGYDADGFHPLPLSNYENTFVLTIAGGTALYISINSPSLDVKFSYIGGFYGDRRRRHARFRVHAHVGALRPRDVSAASGRREGSRRHPLRPTQRLLADRRRYRSASRGAPQLPADHAVGDEARRNARRHSARFPRVDRRPGPA